MANILNDRDIALQATAIRLLKVDSNFISLSSDYAYFNVVNGISSPSIIAITATLNGQLSGTPVFSVVSGSVGISQSTVNGKTVAYLNYTSLTADTAVLRASLTYLGITYTADISLAGQVVKPATPTGFTNSAYGTDIKLSWNKNTDADIAGYEVRTSNINWGLDNSYIFRGSANFCLIAPGSVGSNMIWYLKAYDTTGLYSDNAITTTYVTSAPPNISDIFYEYADTSLTNATITLRWDPVLPVFGLKEYRLSYFSESLATNTTLTVRDNVVILPADWLGNKTFTVVTVDNLGNISSGYSESIAKLAPDQVTNLKAVPIDNTVQLSWSLPVKTSLPISHVLIKKSDTSGTWNTATVIGTKSGEFTTVQELTKGNYVYWVAAVDTDGNESVPVSVPAYVQQPPDFIFNKDFVSTFSGTKTNAVVDSGTLVFPVNTTETWSQHFANNSWSTISAQISAKYPVYIQPGTATADYTEIFDYGNGASLLLGSSNVTVSLAGENIIGNTTIGVTISTSADGVTYTNPVAGFSIFATNFRFIKVILTATRGTGDGVNNIGSVYRLAGLSVRLDTKLKTDSGVVNAISTDIDGGGGTIVNFNSEFIDISSVTLTASGTVPRTCVYSFMDEIYTGTYNIVSNVLTATLSSGSGSGTITDHKLYPGQFVRLSTPTGSLASGVYTVATRPSATTFTATVSAANSSGTLYVYPNTMRVYVFDNNGIRQSQPVSWNVRGT